MLETCPIISTMLALPVGWLRCPLLPPPSQDFGNAAGGFDDGGYGSAAPTSRSSYQDPYSAPPDMMGNGYQAPSTGGYGEPAGGYSSEFSKPMDRGVGDYRSSSVGGYAAPPIAGGGYASSYDDNRGYGGGRQDGGYGSSVPPADGFGARPAVDAYGGGKLAFTTVSAGVLLKTASGCLKTWRWRGAGRSDLQKSILKKIGIVKVPYFPVYKLHLCGTYERQRSQKKLVYRSRLLRVVVSTVGAVKLQCSDICASWSQWIEQESKTSTANLCSCASHRFYRKLP